MTPGTRQPGRTPAVVTVAPDAATGLAHADPGSALTALRATGMPLWDAALALVDAQVDPGAVARALGVVPEVLRPFRFIQLAVGAFRELAERDPDGANAALNAYLADRTVDGALNLVGLNWVTSLPDSFRGADLINVSGSALAALPEGLRTGSLDLSRSAVVSLPLGLRVGAFLDLQGCRAWDGRIPADADIGSGSRDFYAVITDCHPNGIQLERWRKLHPFGEREDAAATLLALRATGMGAVDACDLIAESDPASANALLAEHLPRPVTDLLDLSQRAWLTSLPEGLTLEGRNVHLDLSGCRNLAALPAALRVDGTLILNNCSKLEALPGDLRANGIKAKRCEALARLPEGLVVGGSLSLEGSKNLRELPRNLTVRGYLTLKGTAIATLPDGLKVTGDLDLEGCLQWDGRLPGDLALDGFVYTDRHPKGLTLSDWRRRHRDGEPRHA